jgi:conjugal transfer mating pair stabilization protein TraG
MLKNLPISYQTLLKFQKTAEQKTANQMASANFSNQESPLLATQDQLCKQMIIVNAFHNSTTRFAAERAKDNQRSMYQTAGALAGSSLVTTKVVIEGLIYAAFALIIPLSLLPGGMKFISSWIFLNIWVQLWPPLYAIINYITMIYTSQYAYSVMGGLSNGYSLFTSAGFQDLAYDAAALGGYLSLSVPVISFYLLQNLQSLVHVASSLMSPAQSAATAAATELSTGNYSFANASMGQFSYDNHSAFQHNTSPSLSAGAFTDNHGTHSITYGSESITANQNPSHLNSSIQTAEAYSQQLQNAQQSAQTQVDSSQQLYTETTGTASRNIADIVQHVSQSDMYSNGYSTSETQAAQESANWVKNAAETWGKQNGISSRESLEYFANCGLSWTLGVSTQGGHNQNINALSEESQQSAQSIVCSKDFQEHYQRALSCAHNESANNMTDEGMRYVENYASSMEKLHSAQSQYSSSLSDLNQISENLSYVQSHTSSVNTNLNTDFANWLNQSGKLSTLFDPGSRSELENLRDTFIAEKCQADIGSLQSFKEPGSSSFSSPNLENTWKDLKNATHAQAQNSGLQFGSTQENGMEVNNQYLSTDAKVSSQLNEHQQHCVQEQESLKGQCSEEQKMGTFSRLNDKAGDKAQQFLDSCINTALTPIKNAYHSHWFDIYADPKYLDHLNSD